MILRVQSTLEIVSGKEKKYYSLYIPRSMVGYSPWGHTESDTTKHKRVHNQEKVERIAEGHQGYPVSEL